VHGRLDILKFDKYFTEGLFGGSKPNKDPRGDGTVCILYYIVPDEIACPCT